MARFKVGDRVRVEGEIDLYVGINPYHSSLGQTGTIVGPHERIFDYDGPVWDIRLDNGNPLNTAHDYCSEEYLQPIGEGE